ncbi:MAG: hypothetical protein F6K48_22975 [Okeania sp. SIO3H1]|nr:hypothetical protein [Okeania sp. SIO3H1]
MDYNFDWNPAKEKQNIHKHKLNFRLASTVFHDPYQLTIYNIEPYIEKNFQGMPVDKNLTQEELNQFKKYLKEIPQKYLSYTKLTRDLDHYRLTIDINAQNYKRELNDIQSQLPGENLSFLSQFFDQNYRLFREQLQSDLGYFQHGATLLEKAMKAIQGRVDIEQAQSDRSFQNIDNCYSYLLAPDPFLPSWEGEG